MAPLALKFFARAGNGMERDRPTDPRSFTPVRFSESLSGYARGPGKAAWDRKSSREDAVRLFHSWLPFSNRKRDPSAMLGIKKEGCSLHIRWSMVKQMLLLSLANDSDIRRVLR